jgi:periodic tryptophan protein 2
MGVFEYEVRHMLGAAYSGGGVSFTPDGQKLAVALHGRVQLVDLSAGRARTLPFEAGRSLRTLHVGARAALTVDEAGRAALVALPAGRVVARVTLRLGGECVAARLSPCGRLAAFASGGAVQVWEVPVAGVPEYAAFDKVVQLRAGGAAGKGCLDWSPDARFLAVGGRDGVTYVFTVRRREGARGRVKPCVLYGHRDALTRVLFCGRRGLLTISRDGVLFCWRLRFNERAGDDEFALNDGSESDDEDDVLEGDVGVDNSRVVPVEAKLSSRHFVKAGNGRRVRSAAVHDGLLTVGMSNGVFALYQLPELMAAREDGEFDAGLFELGDQSKARRMEKQAESKRRRAAAEGGGGDGAERGGGDNNDDGGDGGGDERRPRMGFTDLAVLHTLSVSSGALTDIEFSPSGEWLALASSHAGQITVWEWRSETHILKQQAHLLAATTLAFSPDGRAVATGSRDGRVKLWSVANGFCAATFSDHAAAVTSIAFAANDVIVSASLDGTVRAFDIRRYRNFRVMVGPPPHRQFGAVAVDGAGELVAAGCVDTFEIVVWSLRTGNVVELLAGHKGPVSSIAFRPHRGTLASASWDRTVRLWDMYERKGSCEVLEHSKEVLGVCFRPDGRELASATMSGEILLWDAEQGVVSGSIDGARDAAAGRTRDSRTVAPQRGHFQTVSYSADGRFLLAGAASKHVCVYNVKDGTAPSLVDRYAVTDNKNFDGLLDELNSGDLTVGGYAQEVIDDDDEGGEAYGEAKIAAGRSLPGAASELQTRRKKMIKAEVRCVQFCPTGRVWGAVTTEGVMIYAEASSAGIGGSDADSVAFDPTDLDLEVTPDVALTAARNGEHETALLVALRLNERAVTSAVIEAVPFDEIGLMLTRLSPVYFTRLVLLVAWRLDNGPHLAFDLEWAHRLLAVHGARAHGASADPAAVNTALRALHRAVSAHSKRLAPLSTRNCDTLNYLATLAAISEPAG